MNSKQLENVNRIINESLSLYSETPVIGLGLLAMLKAGAIDSRKEAEKVLEIIERRRLEGRLEPLWRAIKYKLTGDEDYKCVHQVTCDVVDDVLEMLRF